MSLARSRRHAARVQRIGHGALEVRELEPALDFYARACNLVPAAPKHAMLRSRFEHHCLALVGTGRSAHGHIGFETLDDATTDEL